jgi:hypothetical protein
MKRTEFKGWLLETAVLSEPDAIACMPHLAWVSEPRRFVVGYARGATEAEAVRGALFNANHHFRKDPDALAGLMAEFFGPAAMLTLPPLPCGRQPAVSGAPAQDSEAAPSTPAAQGGEQPSADQLASARCPGPSPFVIDADPKAGVRLLGSFQRFDRSHGCHTYQNIDIQFDDEPDDAVVAKVEDAGFVRNYEANAWTMRIHPHDGNRLRTEAQRLFEELAAMLRAAKGVGTAPGRAP